MANSVVVQQPNCSASALDWVLFILSLIILCLIWWILEVPQLLSGLHASATSPSGWPSYGDRFRHFYAVASWNCARVLSPSYGAAVSLARSSSATKWPVLYYFGHELDRDVRAPLSFWQWTKIILMDGSVLVAQCLLAYRGAVLTREQEYPRPLLSGWWLFASLPAPITCIFLFIISVVQAPPRRVFIFFLNLLVLALIDTSFLLILYFTSSLHRTAGASFAGGAALSWAFVMFPLPLLRCCCRGPLHLLFYTFATASRMIPLLAEMLVNRSDFVFCGANHLALPVVYGFFAGACVLQCGYASGALCEGHRDLLGNIWDERRAEGEEEPIFLHTGGTEGNNNSRRDDNG
jgi:hypothetical protein